MTFHLLRAAGAGPGGGVGPFPDDVVAGQVSLRFGLRNIVGGLRERYLISKAASETDGIRAPLESFQFARTSNQKIRIKKSDNAALCNASC